MKYTRYCFPITSLNISQHNNNAQMTRFTFYEVKSTKQYVESHSVGRTFDSTTGSQQEDPGGPEEEEALDPGATRGQRMPSLNGQEGPSQTLGPQRKGNLQHHSC